MELEIQVMLVTIGVFSSLVISMTIILIYRGWQKRKKIQKRTLYITNNIDQWFNHLFYGEELKQMTPLKKYEVEAVEKIFFIFLNNGHSEKIDKRIQAFASAHFATGYHRLLKRGKWAERVNTLNKVIQFRVPGFTGLYNRRKIMRLSRFEYFLYLTYLSVFDMTSFMETFFMRKDLSEYEYKKIFNKLDDEQTEILRQHFGRMSDTARYSLIDRTSYIPTKDTIVWLESLLDSEEAEIRIRVLKAIKTIGMIYQKERYMTFKDSGTWEERMLIMRLSPLVGREMIPLLTKGMEDTNEWVKKSAEESLGHFKRQLKHWSVSLDGRGYKDGVE